MLQCLVYILTTKFWAVFQQQLKLEEAHCEAVCSDNAQEARRSRVLLPYVLIEFFFELYFAAALWPWG
jgi:hypothetical protein